jgi:hypothetical protein
MKFTVKIVVFQNITAFNCYINSLFNLAEATCGAHFPAGVDLRVGGPNTDTIFGEWPHICALFKVTCSQLS